MWVQAWCRKVPQHGHKWKQTTSTFSGALLKPGLRVQLWSHLSCDGWDESGCKLTGNEGLYKRTWRIYKSPDNPYTGQLSLQGTESTEWIWTWNALQKPMFFWFGFFFFGVLIFLCFSCSTYIHSACLPDLPTHPRRQTRRREEKDGKELFCLSRVQFPGDFCLFASRFSCAAAGRWDGYIILHRQKEKLAHFSPFPSLLQTWAASKCNSQLQTPSRASPSWGMSDSSLQSTAPSQSTALQTKPVTSPIHSMWYEGNIAQTFY